MSDTLQRKLKDLEEENLSLRSEVTLARTYKHKQKVVVGMQLAFFFLSFFNLVCVLLGQPSEVGDGNIRGEGAAARQ